MSKLDIILLGTTGFTGKHALQYLREFANNRHLTWGVAGRDIIKIRNFLDNLNKETGDKSVLEVPIITVDLTNNESIKGMVQKARLVINCCGPYRLMGESVVQACIEAGTHHVDVSGETYYMEKMHIKYNDMAKEKGVYIVSACGFESIPYEMGVIFLKQKFGGTLHSVETFLKLDTPSGQLGNIGTWNSAVHEMGGLHELRTMRKQFRSKPLPKYEPILRKKLIPYKTEFNKDWTVFAPVPDRFVMSRTQRYFHEEHNARPIQVQTYVQFEKFWNIIVIAIMGLIFIIMARFEAGRSLLLKYPRIFSGGLFDIGEPSEENTEKTSFSIVIIGRGWKEITGGSETQHTSSPDKGIVVRINGKNPAYGATAIALTLAAITILTESSRMPKKGGVYTPGAAFAGTTLIEQLRRNKFSFEIIKEFSIST